METCTFCSILVDIHVWTLFSSRIVYLNTLYSVNCIVHHCTRLLVYCVPAAYLHIIVFNLYTIAHTLLLYLLKSIQNHYKIELNNNDNHNAVPSHFNFLWLRNVKIKTEVKSVAFDRNVQAVSSFYYYYNLSAQFSIFCRIMNFRQNSNWKFICMCVCVCVLYVRELFIYTTDDQ